MINLNINKLVQLACRYFQITDKSFEFAFDCINNCDISDIMSCHKSLYPRADFSSQE